MKKQQQLIISILLTLTIFISLTSQFYSTANLITKGESTAKETENLNSQNQSEDLTLNNKTIEEWQQYEQNLLEALHNNTWGYEEWRDFQVRLGYEMGQLNDEVMQEDYMLHNLYIITLIKWGRFNGSLTDENEEILKDQLIFETTDCNFLAGPITDETIKLSGRVGISGLEAVTDVGYGLRSSDATGKWYSGGLIGDLKEHWENVYFQPVLWIDNLLTPEMEWFDVATIYVPSGVLEEDLDLRMFYTTYFLGIFYIFTSTIYDYDMYDDDYINDTPSLYFTLCHPSGMKVRILNNTVYDIDDIDPADYDVYYIRMEVIDRSGSQWKHGFDPITSPWQYFQGTVPGTIVEFNEYPLSTFFRNYPDAGLIEDRWLFRDNDNDRPNDHSKEVKFRYLLRRFDAGTPSPDGLTVVKVTGVKQKVGLYLGAKEWNDFYKSTCLFDYKENHRKNVVTIELNLQNRENFPIRVKVGGLIPFTHNVQFSLIEDLQNIYFYDGDDTNDYYDGNLVNVWNPAQNLPNIFQNDLTVETNTQDKSFHFWVELMPGESKTIQLCDIAVEDLTLINPDIWLEDFWDRIMALGTAGLSHKMKSITSGWFSDSSGWDLQEFGEILYREFSAENEYSSYEFWGSKYSKGTPTHPFLSYLLDGAKALFSIYFSILEAYAAEECFLNNYEWWWHLNDEADQFHYARGDTGNVWENVEEMLVFDSEYWEPDPEEDLVYYAGIGFVPDDQQSDAVLAYFKTDYLTAGFQSQMAQLAYIAGPAGPLILLLSLAIGICLDLLKNTYILDIANGKDPVDTNYYDKPDEDLVSFPYEDFPELYQGIQSQNDLALKSRETIDLILELEKNGANLLTANDRYNTAYDLEEYAACQQQSQYIQEFADNMKLISSQLDGEYSNLQNLISSVTNNDPFYFSDEEMAILTSPDFEFEYGDKCFEFVEHFQSIRNRDTHVIEDLQLKEQAINSIEMEYQSHLNTMLVESLNTFENLKILSDGLVEESISTYKDISINKLGISPSSDTEIQEDLLVLQIKLEDLAQLIIQEDYYNSICLADEITRDSLDLYYNTFREEFYSIYSAAEGFQKLASQRNQIELKLTDENRKSLINGREISFSFSIHNLIGQGLTDTYDNILPKFNMINLPSGLSFKIYYLDQELEKDGDLYIIPLSIDEFKNLRLQIKVEPGSTLELENIPLILEAFQETPEKSMKSIIELQIFVLDDDVTAPLLSLSHIGGDTDGDVGTIAFGINDFDLGSDATALLSILDDAENTIYINEYSEGTYTLYLAFLDVGQYTVILEGENNDEDGAPEDEEYSAISILFEIVDDDTTAPIINIEYIGNGEDGSPGYFEWNLIDHDEGIGGDHDTGFSIIDITVTYESTEGLPNKVYILPSIESGSWNLESHLGKYTITIFAQDNDDDRTLVVDSLSTFHSEYQHISDDDTNEPIVNFNIIDKYWVSDMIYLRFSVTATDDSGFDLINIQLGNYQWDELGILEGYFQPGYYDLYVSVTDTDDDRDNDALTATLELELDLNPPRTNILIGAPNIPIEEIIHIIPDTAIELISDDGMASTWYRLWNDTIIGDWIKYLSPFDLGDLGLSDGVYTLDYYSIDIFSNTEPINSIILALDNSAPSLEILNPHLDDALQDGVTFLFQAPDLTGVDELKFSIREPGGVNGIIISPEFEEILAIDLGNDLWEYVFDTTLLPDGYYIIYAEASDRFSFYVSASVKFSIRNWAVLELLPSTERNRAGRTMPVKFSLRVAKAVDSEMPFVWNEELDILIYDESNPSVILQLSTYGVTSLDYRITSEGELYITNFKTSKTPAVYIVEIWRKDMHIGSFEFETYNSKNSINNYFYLVAAISIISILGIPKLLFISKKKLTLI